MAVLYTSLILHRELDRWIIRFLFSHSPFSFLFLNFSSPTSRDRDPLALKLLMFGMYLHAVLEGFIFLLNSFLHLTSSDCCLFIPFFILL